MFCNAYGLGVEKWSDVVLLPMSRFFHLYENGQFVDSGLEETKVPRDNHQPSTYEPTNLLTV